jgi:hypothetical protein
MYQHIPILLTSSAIAYDDGVSLRDTKDRVQSTLESVGAWLNIDPKLQIVLCDGSNYDFDGLIKRAFPRSEIECLSFENDQSQVKLNGRGYGEGEIIRFAISHSRFISAAGCFAKCTAKLWVSNYQQCHEQWDKRFTCKGVFSDVFSPFKKTQIDYIDTRFYLTSLDFYHYNLIDIHIKLNKGGRLGLEEYFLETIQEKKTENKIDHYIPVLIL